MKKCVSVIGAAMLFGWTAAADEVPKVETFLGYTYLRANPTTNVSSFGMNGGSLPPVRRANAEDARGDRSADVREV